MELSKKPFFSQAHIDHWIACMIAECWPKFEMGLLSLGELRALQEALEHFGAHAEQSQVETAINNYQDQDQDGPKDQNKEEEEEAFSSDLEAELAEEWDPTPDVVDLTLENS